MGRFTPSLCALVAFSAQIVSSQFSNWDDNQVNTSICTWEQPRAAIIRDIIYLDGGSIWWTPGLSDGTYGTVKNEGNFEGLILTYNLSTPFGTKTNTTGILVDDMLSKARGGEGNSNGAAPNYYDGGMLANDAEFWLYGGAVLQDEVLYDDPDADETLGYDVYQYGPEKSLWQQGFDDSSLDDGVTRYIAYGAAVSAPSENKAWYFSGLTSPTRGPIYSNPDNKTTADTASNTLIVLDMAEQLNETWDNKTLPSSVTPRSNAEVVWVPVGEQGILVVLGGVVYPEWAGDSHQSDNKTASEKQSPTFMEDIDIYDIANEKWYQQPTEDGPSTRSRGCAVVATASDSSSFNIYYYGGFDGINPTEAFHDDVWVLSLPSFTWTQINKGKDSHARAGHKCFRTYEDQMMVLAGYTSQSGSTLTCLEDGPVLNFNLSSGEWLDSYDPSEYGDYLVHEDVQAVIGGHASGGATATTPVPSGWATSALGNVFATSYSMDKINTYYPYASATPSTTTRPTAPGDDDNDNGGGGGLPSWVGPVLGVILGLLVVISGIIFFILWRRRKASRNGSSEEAGLRIMSWIRGQPAAEKASTVTTTEMSAQPVTESTDPRAYGSISSAFAPSPSPLEMPDTQVAELGDTSPPAELHDTGLSPIDIMQKYSRSAAHRSDASSQDSYSMTMSYVSSGYLDSIHPRSPRPGNAIVSDEQVESPVLAHSPADRMAPPRQNSEVSGVSDESSPPSHSRQPSQADVVSATTGMTPMADRPSVGRVRTVSQDTQSTMSPVSPPSASEEFGENYGARHVVSPVRKSTVHEEDED